ncbi:conserved protein of unknown function [Enterobacter cancerogenus]|uniref:hypothetical protein n=1 Tax=Enterobacter cancerogenus TaxID=69218 RepID=UPI001AF5139D|nr:hypothetical protein [Enterobacter cancerogenus]CAD5356083.1 conserved protein of unknown function [Enterobacter cancerogenus]
MTNVSAVEKMAELMQQMEENSPRVATLQYFLAQLEARCAALAAENARCKFEISRCHQTVNEMFKNREKWIDKEWLSSIWSTSKRLMEETPATDAFLAEVRGQGVERLASLAGNECQRYKSVNDRAGARKWKSIVILCTDFAAQLRKGVQS